MITILVENQIIDIHWTNMNKDWYIGKGYDFTKIGDYLQVKAEDLSHGSNIKVLCECDYCGKIYSLAYATYLKSTKNDQEKVACISCREKKRSEYRRIEERERCFNNFLSICEDKGYVPLSVLSDYHNSKSLMKYICPIHGEQKTTYNSLQSGVGCPVCGNARAGVKHRIPIKEVVDIIHGKNNDELLNQGDYVSVTKSNLKVRCGSCGCIFTTSLAAIQTGGGSCPKCKNKKIGGALRHDTNYVRGIIEAKNNNILLNPDDYTNAATKNLLVKCGSCGNKFYVSLSNYDKNITGKCPDCNEISFGEYIIAEFLDDSKIEYERQKTFNGCKNIRQLPFDFYLPEYNLCIEFDGYHHYHPMYNEDVYIRTASHDKIKNDYCEQNGIDLFRIPYWEIKNINNILKNKLNLTA